MLVTIVSKEGTTAELISRQAVGGALPFNCANALPKREMGGIARDVDRDGVGGAIGSSTTGSISH